MFEIKDETNLEPKIITTKEEFIAHVLSLPLVPLNLDSVTFPDQNVWIKRIDDV